MVTLENALQSDCVRFGGIMDNDWYRLLHEFCNRERITKTENVTKAFRCAYERGIKDAREAAQKAASKVFIQQFWSEFK